MQRISNIHQIVESFEYKTFAHLFSYVYYVVKWFSKTNIHTIAFSLKNRQKNLFHFILFISPVNINSYTLIGRWWNMVLFILVITDSSLNIRIEFIFRTSSIRDRNKLIQVDSKFLALVRHFIMHGMDTLECFEVGYFIYITDVWRSISFYRLKFRS